VRKVEEQSFGDEGRVRDLGDNFSDRGGLNIINMETVSGEMGQLKLGEKSETREIKNTECDADSGVDETTQSSTEPSRTRPATASRIPRKTPPESPIKRIPRPEQTQQKSAGPRRIPRSKSVPKQPFTSFSLSAAPTPSKKVPMNKVSVGHAPSPNLLSAQSRVNSLTNHKYKPGGGNVKIESRKLEWNTEAKTKVINETYVPGGGDKKIESRRLTWNAESRIGSLAKSDYKPSGGDVKIENRKLEWSAESRIGSTKNMKHKPGGGNIKIHDNKLEIHASSRVGSLANVKHRPGGGDKKIFDDKEYIRQMTVGSEQGSQTRSGPSSINGSFRGSNLQSPEPGEDEIF